LIQRELYEFGPYVLDSEQMILRTGESVVQLPPRVLETLLALVKRRGEVVTKQQLMETVWPDSFVEEGNLTQNVFLLRRVLGKTDRGEEYIQTLPRRGYRMSVPIVEVKRTGGVGGSASPHEYGALEKVGAEAHGLTAPAVAARSSRRGWSLWVPAGSVLVLAVFVAGVWRRESTVPRVSGYVQITHDGAIKRGKANQVGGPDAALFTDGPRVYFMEGSSDAPIIAQVSASGGETGQIAVPFELPELLDVSRVHSELLVGGIVDPAARSPLWVVPVPAGTAHPLDDISAWDASWSPDGREMVYVQGVALYRAKSDGSESKRLVTLPGLGWQPRWSPDGQRLRLTVFDVKAATSTMWEVSREGTNLRPLLADWRGGDQPADGPANVCCGSWSPDRKYFVFQETRGGRSEIWSMPAEPGILVHFSKSIGAPVQITSGQLSSLAPVFSPDGSKLFLIGQQLRGELQRFDLRTGQYVPYLGGISADFVDFSRDGQWITYVTYPEGTLWRCRIDGSDRLQLTFPPMEATVPKWSPDGSQIAFYGMGAGKEQRLYLIAASGGAAKPAAAGAGGEMQASWSPDGASLMYRVMKLRVLPLVSSRFARSFAGRNRKWLRDRARPRPRSSPRAFE
jgi:DNA-binding winged helix-turn-helix (wHTH) protein/Tol biopolymer transport system component